MTAAREFEVASHQAGETLAALLRQWLAGHSWSQVRRLVDGRRVLLNGELWLDSARRLKEGERVEVLQQPRKKADLVDSLVFRHVDEHVLVVEKPSGIPTVRHPAERDWMADRRLKVPTLDDLALVQLGERLPRMQHERRPRLRIVHRLDKETSGLVVFARTVEAERGLGSQFAQHTVIRKYLAVVAGHPESQTIRTTLIRDRGDGRRGSTRSPVQAKTGKLAITHIEVVERLRGYTLLSCRLETGRTHQIRIHLAELGHAVCGEQVYNRIPGREAVADRSGAPRLALHAAELGFVHPFTGESMHWEMPLTAELSEFVDRLRGSACEDR